MIFDPDKKSIGDLYDYFDDSATPNDGDTFVYNKSTGKFGTGPAVSVTNTQTSVVIQKALSVVSNSYTKRDGTDDRASILAYGFEIWEMYSSASFWKLCDSPTFSRSISNNDYILACPESFRVFGTATGYGPAGPSNPDAYPYTVGLDLISTYYSSIKRHAVLLKKAATDWNVTSIMWNPGYGHSSATFSVIVL